MAFKLLSGDIHKGVLTLTALALGTAGDNKNTEYIRAKYSSVLFGILRPYGDMLGS